MQAGLASKIMKNLVIKTPRGERIIGPGQRVFIIAEMSGNHNQSIDRAYEIIDAAAEAGVDAIKLQTYTADTITINCDNEYFRIKESELWSGQTLYELYQKAYTPWDWQPKLKDYAEKKGLIFFSTPFDETSVDFLEKMNVGLYKIASLEIVDIPLLKRVAKTGKPVIMSRGASTIADIELALKTLKENGSGPVAVLHCLSSYPAESETMNLKTIKDIMEKFDVVSGLSDHSLDREVDIASIALGASIIEKHFTLSREEGVDASFSLLPKEMKELVKAIRKTEDALGEPFYGTAKGEEESVLFRKSLFVVLDIKKGEKFTKDNIRSIRPGQGLHPKYYEDILGKAAKNNLVKGTPLSWELVEK
jgi:pseudaminic acid synthase